MLSFQISPAATEPPKPRPKKGKFEELILFQGQAGFKVCFCCVQLFGRTQTPRGKEESVQAGSCWAQVLVPWVCLITLLLLADLQPAWCLLIIPQPLCSLVHTLLGLLLPLLLIYLLEYREEFVCWKLSERCLAVEMLLGNKRCVSLLGRGKSPNICFPRASPLLLLRFEVRGVCR